LRDKADASRAPARRFRGAEWASYGLIIGAVLLGWQIAIQPFIKRAPVEVAVRLSPDSPLVLRRAAEAELAAGRDANAASLGRSALSRSPFDVRALRVVGLTEAHAGRDAQADDILTLAGNWSLRDDPTHAWLIEHRLRQGDYTSGFAHADTLVRRREDIQPQVFRLFTVAGTEDRQRSLPVLARLLAASPPWRSDYFDSLNASPQGVQIAASLAVMLQPGRTPLTNEELRPLYMKLLQMGQFEALRTVRDRLKRPPVSDLVTNGEFGAPSAPEPFQWRLAQRAGAVAEIAPSENRDPALRIEYDGYNRARIASQLLLLSPGRYRLTYAVREESGDARAHFVWKVACLPGERLIASSPAEPGTGTGWTSVSLPLTVPANCPAQWLRLEGTPGDKRSLTAAWFDRVSIVSAGEAGR